MPYPNPPLSNPEGDPDQVVRHRMMAAIERLHRLDAIATDGASLRYALEFEAARNDVALTMLVELGATTQRRIDAAITSLMAARAEQLEARVSARLDNRKEMP